ncbi:hypothetical protein H2248_004377 [Termitomyces sp. 'cryptogamus']|nr:hypothetical protein H2248_004377 [Termitomyces sp. 'cryptogamus']
MHLFDGVRYSLSTSLSESRINELSHVLDSNGASCVQSIDDAALTHFITNSNSFEGWQEIATREEEGYLVVVTDKWVDKSLILGKLQHSSFYSADPAMIFSGVVACAAELETTDLEVLSAGITALGGQWRTGLTKDVTHLFVTKNTSAKYSTAMHFRNDTHVKILLPHWFDDAVRLGIGGLDTTPYEWPDPPMLRAHGAEDGEGAKGDAMKRSALRKLDNEKKSLYRTVDLLFPGAPLPNDEERMSESTIESPRGKSKNVWEGRRVLLGRSLELSGSRRDAVEAEIRRAGGKIVSYEGGKDEEAAAIDECDVLITRFRSGKAYVQAIRHNKTIGTLPWVFHVHSIGTLSPPMDQLLWYPIPKRPIEGFSGHEITVTNYTGESREYIKKLIIAMGAVFTPSMSGKNTVLIAAYISGQKTEKAASWSIPIVNHLWLEDCFVKWRNLTVALEKYIVFPPGVDFSRQLGDRGVGRGVEEIGEDDLEFLEQEDDVEETVAPEPQSEVSNPQDGEKKTNGSAEPLSTPGSTRDAKEVEEVVRADGDGDLHMQVELQAFQVEVEELTTTKMAENEDEDEDEPMEEEEEPPASFRPTLTPRSTKSIVERIQDKGESAAKTRIKSRSQGRPKEDRGATPEVAITKRKSGQSKVTPMKKRSRVDSGSSTSSDDEFEIVEATAKRASKKLVRRVGERNDTWIMDAVEVTPLRPEKAAYESRDESEQEEDVPQKPRSRVLKKSPSKRILSDEESEKMTRKRSRKDLFIDDEADDAGNHESNAISVKEGKKRAKLDEEEEEESSVEAKSRNAVMKPSMSSKGGGRGTRPSWESEDEDMDVVSTSKSKAKPKMVEVERPRPKPTAKAKKFVEPSAFAEENESSLSLQPAAVKSRTSFSKSKKIFTPPVSDEDEPSTSRKTIVQPRASTSKSRKAPKLLTPDEDHSPAKRSATKPGPSSSKSKKISPSMLDEDDEPSPSKKHASKTTALASKKSKKATAPPVLDEDSDLTPPPISPAKKAMGKNAQAQNSKKGKSKAVSEDEDEDDGPQRASKTYAIKSNGHSKPSTDLVSLTTPKRTVSVLLPGLSLSTKKASQSKDVASTSLSHSDSIRVVANERASRGRTATTSGSATKAKAKAKPAPAPSRSMSPPPTTDDDTPVISSGRAKRGAAARASQKLHEEIMPDVMTFQQEMRNVGKGRRSLGAISMPGASGSANKRHLMDKSSDEEEGHSRNVKRPRLSTSHAMKGKATAGQEDQEENEPSRPVKGKGKKKPDDDGEGKGKPAKSKTTKVDGVDLSVDSKPGTVRLMTTQVPLSDDVAKVLIKLGVKITVKPSECTHLLAPHLVRTEKFLCALASAPFIMTDRWAIESAAAKKLLDERNYLLRDKINEKKFDFVLADALSRAKKLRGTLFSKMVFYITPKVSVNIQLLKNVVTACGGQVNTQIPTLRIMNASNDRYLISCPADAAIWRPIASTHPIYTQELILTSALRQEIDWDNENYRVPNSIFR